MPKDGDKRPRFVRVRRPAPGQPEEQAELPAPAEAAPEGTEAHTRIVVPRQGRTDAAEVGQAEADVELREVRFGATSRGPYLRMVPRPRRLKRVAPGRL